jgi:hypothetical protein
MNGMKIVTPTKKQKNIEEFAQIVGKEKLSELLEQNKERKK